MKPTPRQRGMSLIELMVGMLLGLLISLAASSVFLANQRTFAAANNLGLLQDNGRYAFEMMARDIREAGGNACAKNLPIANVLKTQTSWWASWGNPVLGYDNGGLTGSLAGSDAIELKSGDSTGLTVTAHNPTSATFTLNTASHELAAGDILMICDYRQAAIFQMSGPNATNATVVHNTGSGTPGNCSKGLGFKQPIDCSTNGTAYTYGANSTIAKLRAVRWYLADNGRGSQSLFRGTLGNSGGNAAEIAEEVVDGISDLQISYLVSNASDYVAASIVPAERWSDVRAVRIVLGLEGEARVGSDGDVLRRELSHIVTLRNRLP